MDALLIAARALHFASSAMFAGGVVFACWVARPAAGATSLRRTDRRLKTWVAANLAVAVASGAGWLALVAAAMTDRPVATVLADSTWWIVLTQTQFGLVWQLRLLCAVLLTPMVASLGRAWVSRLAPALALLYVGGLAWMGHAGATPGSQGYVHVGADVVHLAAASVWLGGLPPLLLLLGEKSGVSAEAANEITHRFSGFGIASVMALLAGGLVNSWFLVGSMQALTHTGYGRLLLLKIALVVAMIALATANRLRYLPRLSAGGDAHQFADARRRLRRNTIMETVFGLAVIVVVGKLGIMAPVAHLMSHAH